jgi:hypothetical protein
MRSLRTSALTTEQGAVMAGATAADLSKGSAAFASAESLATARRLPEAMMQFATAASLWSEAERQSRSRAARDTESHRAAVPPLVPPPVAVATAPTDPKPDIQKTVDSYARALESRDITQVRSAYPGLTTAQQESWQRFFDRVRNLKASLIITEVSVSGTTAEATIGGVYEYDNATTGRAERRPVTFAAILTRDANGWRLTTIR